MMIEIHIKCKKVQQGWSRKSNREATTSKCGSHEHQPGISVYVREFQRKLKNHQLQSPIPKKIPTEVEVVPRYKLLKLFTLLTLFNLFTLFSLFTLFCKHTYVLLYEQNAMEHQYCLRCFYTMLTYITVWLEQHYDNMAQLPFGFGAKDRMEWRG